MDLVAWLPPMCKKVKRSRTRVPKKGLEKSLAEPIQAHCFSRFQGSVVHKCLLFHDNAPRQNPAAEHFRKTKLLLRYIQDDYIASPFYLHVNLLLP